MLGLGLALTNFGTKGGIADIADGGFTPASLFEGGTYGGDWWTVSDLSTLKQNTAGTTAVSANDDPVAYWLGKVNATVMTNTGATDRPLYKSSNGTLLTDGTNDYLMTADIAAMAGYPVSIIAIVDQSVATAANPTYAVATGNTDYRNMRSIASGSQAVDRNAAVLTTSPASLSSPGASGFAIMVARFETGNAYFRFNNGTEASVANTNSHASAARAIFGAQRHSGGTPNSFGAARCSDMIVINKSVTTLDIAKLAAWKGVSI